MITLIVFVGLLACFTSGVRSNLAVERGGASTEKNYANYSNDRAVNVIKVASDPTKKGMVQPVGASGNRPAPLDLVAGRFDGSPGSPPANRKLSNRMFR